MAGSVTYDCGSAFHALGLPDADDLQLRAELLMAIEKIVAERKLNKREPGNAMRHEQAPASTIIGKKISELSTANLIWALRDLGCDIEIRITSAEIGKGIVRVRHKGS